MLMAAETILRLGWRTALHRLLPLTVATQDPVRAPCSMQMPSCMPWMAMLIRLRKKKDLRTKKSDGHGVAYGDTIIANGAICTLLLFYTCMLIVDSQDATAIMVINILKGLVSWMTPPVRYSIESLYASSTDVGVMATGILWGPTELWAPAILSTTMMSQVVTKLLEDDTRRTRDSPFESGRKPKQPR